MRFGLAFILLFLSFLSAWGQEKDLITWNSIQKADSLQLNGDSRFLLVDVFTDWCGPCKLMDKNTFHNEKVAQFINENFIPVKLNAESKLNISFKGKEYKWVNYGRSGLQSLAYVILGGNLIYPSIAFVDNKGQTITIINGYFQAEEFLKIIQDLKIKLEKYQVKEQ